MSVDLGWKGAAYIGANKIAEINVWTATFGAREEETQSFGDEAVEITYTIKEASGDFSGRADKSDTTGQKALIDQFLSGGTPALVFLYLYKSGAVGYYGNAAVTVTDSWDSSTVANFSATWRSSGQWYQNIA